MGHELWFTSRCRVIPKWVTRVRLRCARAYIYVLPAIAHHHGNAFTAAVTATLAPAPRTDPSAPVFACSAESDTSFDMLRIPTVLCWSRFQSLNVETWKRGNAETQARLQQFTRRTLISIPCTRATHLKPLIWCCFFLVGNLLHSHWKI